MEQQRVSIPDETDSVRAFAIPEEYRGERLDKVLARMLPEYSRARLQAWLKAGAIAVDAATGSPARTRVRGGERVVARLRAEPVAGQVSAEPIALEVLHQDADLLVVNKPAGLVVHPGAGNPDGTLQNALLHHDPALAAVPRAGIVHRLDKGTSGLLVVARTLAAHKQLVAALAKRSITREYEAIVCGVLTAGGQVDAPIGRHPVDRKRMAVRPEPGRGARPALTHYRVLQRFAAHSHIRAQLASGRTHQIRVHMQHIRHPLVGDPVYGGRLAIPAGASADLDRALRGFRRQALHAKRLGLVHPITGAPHSWSAPPPADFEALLAALASDAAARGDG